MHRRHLLAALSLGTATSVAGCTGMLSSQNTTNERPQQTSTKPKPEPTVNWTETWLGSSGYRVKVDVDLDGAKQLNVYQGHPSGSPITSIQSNGEHVLAGENTEFGTIEAGYSLSITRPKESEFEDINNYDLVGSHFVGSQEQPSVPAHVSALNGSTDPDLETSGTLSREYTQRGSIVPSKLSLKIPRALYQYYKNRRRVQDYGAYVSDTYDDEYIAGLVDEMERFGEQNNLEDPGIINLMTSFVQNLEYTSDRVSAGYNEYPKYPIETLVDREGDCEDTCILLASMLEQFGYGAVLLLFREEQHMALGVAGEAGLPGSYYEQNGRRYYYVETTAKGWRIGEVPPDMKGADAELVPINSNGVLVFSYAVGIPSDGSVPVEITIRNVGDASGRAHATATFENRNGETVASGRTSQTHLAPQSETSAEISLAPPDDQTLRANVSVYLDGAKQDLLTSEWREPSWSG